MSIKLRHQTASMTHFLSKEKLGEILARQKAKS